MALPTTPPIAGRYQLLRHLASGGFADTYVARDLTTDGEVVIKRFHDAFGQDPSFARRFAREARLARAVTHPNVVTVFDAGHDPSGLYLAMEWVDGADLKQHLRTAAPLPVNQTLAILDDLLAGLDAIHQAGIIHRDLKPQNILLAADGRAKIADFGIARAAADTGLTHTGQAVGTAAYMAPEQASGATVSPTSDLYAVGVILFELLTGQLPFSGTNAVEVMYRQVHEPPPQPGSLNRLIPAALEEIILRLLAKAPGERYPDVPSLREALRHCGSATTLPMPGESTATTQRNVVADQVVVADERPTRAGLTLPWLAAGAAGAAGLPTALAGNLAMAIPIPIEAQAVDGPANSPAPPSPPQGTRGAHGTRRGDRQPWSSRHLVMAVITLAVIGSLAIAGLTGLSDRPTVGWPGNGDDRADGSAGGQATSVSTMATELTPSPPPAPTASVAASATRSAPDATRSTGSGSSPNATPPIATATATEAAQPTTTISEPALALREQRYTPGDMATLPAFTVIRGDVTVDGRFLADERPETGLIVILRAPATVAFPYGGSIVSGAASLAHAEQLANQHAQSMLCAPASSCQSVDIVQVP